MPSARQKRDDILPVVRGASPRQAAVFAAAWTALKTPTTAREHANQDSPKQRSGIKAKVQFREPKKSVIHSHQSRPEDNSTERSHEHPHDNDRARELQVMHHDRMVGKAERFEDGDLIALHGEKAREDRVDHERSHAEKTPPENRLRAFVNTRISSLTRMWDG
jgi:hypothetical protein